MNVTLRLRMGREVGLGSRYGTVTSSDCITCNPDSARVTLWEMNAQIITDDAQTAVNAALAVLAETSVPQELRETTYAEVLKAFLRERQVGDPSGRGTPSAVSSEESLGHGLLTRVARAAEVPVELVEEIYYLGDAGEALVGLAASKFGSSKSEATRRVCLLVALPRQVSGDEQWTSTSVLRDACQEYGVLDSANFARNLLALSDIFQFQGSGPQRKVRLTRRAYEAAGQLMRELVA